MFSQIIVAVDGSQHAQNAIKAACDIAKHYNAKIHLVHTPQVDTTALAIGAGSYMLEASLEQIADAGKRVMAQARETCESCGIKPATAKIGSSDPAFEILEVAKEKSADLIVCGRRGLGNLTALLLGSTSAKISHDADCAVLTVK